VHTAKKEAIEAIEKLPENVSMDEIAYRLFVISKVQQGVRDLDAGRVLTTDEIAREIERW
jgi:predicted transcriptional regulator